MKNIKSLLCGLLICAMLVGCNNDLIPIDEERDSVSKTGESESLSPAEQEEQDIMDNLPVIDLDFTSFVEKLSNTDGFKLNLENAEYVEFSTAVKGVTGDVIEKDSKISVVIVQIDSAILEKDNRADIKVVLEDIFNILDYTYDDEILDFLYENYETELKITRETGIADIYDEVMNSDQGWEVWHKFIGDNCIIELRPYDERNR